jgi:hypothetical protein
MAPTPMPSEPAAPAAWSATDLEAVSAAAPSPDAVVPAGQTPVPPGVGSEAALAIVSASDAHAVAMHVENLLGDKPNAIANSARLLDELVVLKPELLSPSIDKLVLAVTSSSKRAVLTAAAALPVMAKLAPARVARHLPALTDRFIQASDVGKDGLVSTFAALCTASVAYQKRLEPVLEIALSSAEPKTLQRWTEVVLPSLKGEPHARARAVVEQRLYIIPRPVAQPIAAFLGIKLRPAAR